MKSMPHLKKPLLFSLFSLVTLSVQAQLLTKPPANSERPDTIAPGLQGSVNPMLDNNYVLTGDDLLDESFPNSWPLFGSAIRLKIGGFVKGDFIRDFDYIADRFEFELGSIAVDGSPERDLGGTTTFHAKQTRLNFDFRSKAKWLTGREFPLQVFLEVDWFFDAEGLRLNTRLRHAYGVIGRLLIGQTWTNSADLSTLPGTIDFAAGDALYGGRVTQIRWQDKINDRFTYLFAAEEPLGQVDNPEGLAGAFRPLWPKMVGALRWSARNGSSLKLGLDVFPISWRGPADGPNVSKTGYALVLNGRAVIKLQHYADAFVYGVGYGQGQGHQIISLAWDGKASGVITSNGLRLSPAWYGYVGYNHYWSKSLNSNVSTAWTSTDLSAEQADETIQRAGSVHANLIWFPYERVSTGIEYMWGVRVNKNGVQGTASRLQFMAKFKFN